MVQEGKYLIQVLKGMDYITLKISQLPNKISFQIATLDLRNVLLTFKWDTAILDQCLEDKKVAMFLVLFKNQLELFLQSNPMGINKTEQLKTVKYHPQKGKIGDFENFKERNKIIKKLIILLI